jgi:hypothetical protein
MKKVYLLALLPLLAFTLVDWQSFAIDKRLIVQLPTPPAEVNLTKVAPAQAAAHARMWALRAAEAVYLVVRLPTGLIGKSDTTSRRSYYAGVLSAVLQDERGQLISQTSFPTAGGAGMEIKYKAMSQVTGKKAIKYMRFLLVDSIGYSLLFQPTDKQDSLGLASAEQRRRFFNSITVKP